MLGIKKSILFVNTTYFSTFIFITFRWLRPADKVLIQQTHNMKPAKSFQRNDSLPVDRTLNTTLLFV
jgi:hypothetical protein